MPSSSAAVCIDALLLLRGRAKAACGTAVLAFAVCYLLAGAAVDASPALPETDADDAVPYMHWVMMGLSGVGGYNNDDYELTLSGGTAEGMRAVDEAEIARRLETMARRVFCATLPISLAIFLATARSIPA